MLNFGASKPGVGGSGPNHLIRDWAGYAVTKSCVADSKEQWTWTPGFLNLHVRFKEISNGALIL